MRHKKSEHHEHSSWGNAQLTRLTRLSKSRKKRPVPEGWATPDDITTFAVEASTSLPIVKPTTTLASQGAYGAIGGSGDVALYSVEEDELWRRFSVRGNVTDLIWEGNRIFLSTDEGLVIVASDEHGDEVASFADHAGPATGLALHPSKAILASVGADKSFVFYDLVILRRAARVYTNAGKLHCRDHSPLELLNDVFVANPYSKL
jgi:pre-mRNA-processing factor 19